MKTNTRLILCVALLTAGLLLPASRLCQAADDDKPNIPRLIWWLEHPDPTDQRPPEIDEQEWGQRKHQAWAEARSRAREDLTRAGAAAVVPLVELIERSKDFRVGIPALTALSLMTNPADLKRAERPMLELLADEKPGIRYLAAKTLGAMKSRRAAPALIKLLADKEDVVRLGAIDALGNTRGGAKAATPLRGLLDHGQKAEGEDSENNKAIRLHTVKALGKLGVALDVVDDLIKKLRSKDINERETAVDAIKNLLGFDIRGDGLWLIADKLKDPKKRKPLVKAFEAWWNKTKADRKFVVKDFPELALRVNMIAHQKNQRRDVKLKAIEWVSISGNPRAVDYLIIAMSTPDKDLRTKLAKVATKLSTIKIEHLGTETDARWGTRIGTFRLGWGEIRDRVIEEWDKRRAR